MYNSIKIRAAAAATTLRRSFAFFKRSRRLHKLCTYPVCVCVCVFSLRRSYVYIRTRDWMNTYTQLYSMCASAGRQQVSNRNRCDPPGEALSRRHLSAIIIIIIIIIVIEMSDLKIARVPRPAWIIAV